MQDKLKAPDFFSLQNRNYDSAEKPPMIFSFSLASAVFG